MILRMKDMTREKKPRMNTTRSQKKKMNTTKGSTTEGTHIVFDNSEQNFY
jgi:hypothetical protein